MASDDIQGKVTDSDGNAVSAAEVYLFSQDNVGSVIKTTTDSNGNYIFEHHPDGDGTSQQWYVTTSHTDVDQFTAYGKPYVSAQISSAIPDSGLARWTLDTADLVDTDNDGTAEAQDSWGSNHGELNGGVTTGAAGANQTYTTNEAISFDGVDDYVETPLASDAGGTNGFSVAGWVYIDASTDGNTLLGGLANDQSSGWATKVEVSSNQLRFTKQGIANYDLSVTLSSDTWYHTAFVVETDDSISYYLDGNSEGSLTASAISTTTENIAIGQDGAGNAYMEGDVDDPRLYSKALTATEVSNLYTNGSI